MAKGVRYSDKELIEMLNIDSNTLNMFKKVREKALLETKNLTKKKTGKIKVLGISGSARDEMIWLKKILILKHC